jgi:hypothetical protein
MGKSLQHGQGFCILRPLGFEGNAARRGFAAMGEAVKTRAEAASRASASG